MTENLPQTDLDNWYVQDTDYVLSGESPLIIAKIKEMPVLDSTRYAWNQYVHARHNDSCTKFRWYNARCTMFNHRGSREEIDKIEAKSLEMWWLWVGHWWSSSQWCDAVRKVMNELYPNQIVSKRYYDFGSDAHELLKEKHRPMNVSIVVDSEYWKQSKTWRITWTKFKKNYGHADTVCVWDGTEYTMIESVGWRAVKIAPDVWDALVENWNIRKYGYVLLPIDASTLPEWSITTYLTFAKLKKILQANIDKKKETKNRLVLKWPVLNWPRRILKTEPIIQKDGKKFIMYKWFLHEVVKWIDSV